VSLLWGKGENMTTEITFKDGKCAYIRPIRVKIWKGGFTIKCFKTKKTILVRPFNKESLDSDLAFFCENCKVKTT
jgi:hypothetical protein